MKKTVLYMILAILIAIVAILASVIYYERGIVKKSDYHDRESTHSTSKQIISKKQLQLDVTRLTVNVKEKTDILSIATEIDDYVHSQKERDDNHTKVLKKPSCKVIKQKPIQHKKTFHDHIPRVAIIMDDIGNAHQMSAFLKIPFTVTPSIFPATSRHQSTPKFAKKCRCYMVHMPMEAFHFARPEENTLEVNDSLSAIDAKIAAMHKDFPNAVAINNHTGSKFTSDMASMDRLFCVLDKYNIQFIDSKTAPHTKGKIVGKLHNKVVWERNIFLDNEPNVAYILNQLKKTVRYAKKHGVAIAICHPRPETFEAFEYAQEILKDVKMITIDELL